jgi:spermidine synthase
MIVLVYIMFFLSGAAALMYEVTWVRSLSLIFGGSHLAVSTVLSIFMGGLAIGSYIIGRYIDRIEKPLRLYGQLEIGVALFAVLFIFLIKVYPAIYVLLAHGEDESILYLSFVRVVFAIFALIIPTSLMGGTLPVLSRFASYHSGRVGRSLALLYGVNTLGAVTGTLVAGFYLLRYYSVMSTLKTAIVINVVIGTAGIFLQKKASETFGAPEPAAEEPGEDRRTAPEEFPNDLPFKYILWGIGISGFCALGYEVLWTRILSIVVGSSVYGFTAMLAAFLTGIALGSKAYGLFVKIIPFKGGQTGRLIAGFGIVQIMIGLSAILVTIYLRDLPDASLQLRGYFKTLHLEIFELRQWRNLLIAFMYMFVPAFFMGLAFPLAGQIHAAKKKTVGSAVGDILAYNTAGAILGSALSGYVMLYLFGIERSLQLLFVVNIGLGLLVIASLKGSKLLRWGIMGLAGSFLLFLALNPDVWRIWNEKYFAIFRANQPEAFRTPELIEQALENTEVLYYGVGTEAIVSSIKIKGGMQSFITNGRVEATDYPGDLQVQFTLGHLPMLLNKNPRTVLVIGLGSGMTAGATSVYPGVEKIRLVELEPKMKGVAKTFARYNHNVLDNPKLKIIYNDGRNYLLTTKEKFDVITADPIHPWFRGAGYLYTTEYFKLASQHLHEGGVICQWLPIYELTVDDLKSVVRTFRENFPYTLLWLTHWDSVIVGSNSPITLDEDELGRRIAWQPVANDLKEVMMGSAKDFLSYFTMGSEGMEEFARGGIINTDDNLYLEFSAPMSIGKGYLIGQNIDALVKRRESILPYLVPARDEKGREEQKKQWEAYDNAARIYDKAHQLFFAGPRYKADLEYLLHILDMNYPWYAPARFLKARYASRMEGRPRLLKKTSVVVLNKDGGTSTVEVSAVISRFSDEMAIVDFVENNQRIIFGHLNVPGAGKDEFIDRFVDNVFKNVQEVYQGEAKAALKKGKAYPQSDAIIDKIKKTIESQIQNHK